MEATIKDGKELRLSAKCTQMTDSVHYYLGGFNSLMSTGAPASLAGILGYLYGPLARTRIILHGTRRRTGSRMRFRLIRGDEIWL